MNPRMRRLKADFDSVREEFSGHPHLRIDPIGFQRPPESYRIEYRLRGLRLEGDQPVVVESHEVEVMLPLRYPAEPPYAVPKTSIFHPNIREYFCTADFWAAETNLTDVIIKIGDMIQWRTYNVGSPLDAIAARWANDNEAARLFPVGNVDLGQGEVEIGVGRKEPESIGEGSADPSTPLPRASSTSGEVLGSGDGSDDDFVIEFR